MDSRFETQGMIDGRSSNGALTAAATELVPAAGETESGADEFGRMARRIGRRLKRMTPLLRKLAPLAVTAVGGPAGGLLGGLLREDEEDELFQDEAPDPELEGFGEAELLSDDGESEGEDEDEEVPGLSPEHEALADMLAAAAAEAESEEEAAGFIGGLTILILSPAPARIRRLMPVVLKRNVRLGRLLRRSPRTRPLMPVLATVTRRTAGNLVRQGAAGRPINPAAVVRTMARQTARTFGSPQRVARAMAGNIVRRRRLERFRSAAARVEH